MCKMLGLFATVAILVSSTIAEAHTLRLQCKRMSGEEIVCRTITSDGELARGVDVQVLASSDYAVLASGKTDAAGAYTFKAPAVLFHIIAVGDKAHVTNLAGVDIW